MQGGAFTTRTPHLSTLMQLGAVEDLLSAIGKTKELRDSVFVTAPPSGEFRVATLPPQLFCPGIYHVAGTWPDDVRASAPREISPPPPHAVA